MDKISEISFDYNALKLKLIKTGHLRQCKINLDNPITIQDKLNYLKLYDTVPIQLKSSCADKIKLHNYVKEKLGKDICIPIIHIFTDIEDFIANFDIIPNNCVIKCNHGSGYMHVVKDKSTINKETIINDVDKWLKEDYGLNHWGCQIHYSLIEPKVYIEQLMSDVNNPNLLVNYKIWCFNGVPTYMEIYQSESGNNDTHERINMYDMNGNFIPELSQYGHSCDSVRKDKMPKNFDLMKQYANILSQDFTFVRVDFYEINNIIYLGELTFTPNNCFGKWDNDNKTHISEKLGNLLKI